MRYGNKRDVAALLAVVCFVRLFILVAIHTWSISVGSDGFAPIILGGDDGDEYYEAALAIVDQRPFLASNIYPVLIGHLMALTGIRAVFFYKLINWLAGCAAIWLAIQLMRALADHDYSKGKALLDTKSVVETTVLFALYPSAVFCISFSLWRDALIFFVHMLCVFLLVAWPKNRRFGSVWIHGLLLLLSLAALGALRWYASAAVLLGTAIWLVARCFRPFRSMFAAAAAVLALTSLVAGALLVLWVAGFAPGSDGFDVLLAYRSTTLDETLVGGSNLHIDYSTCGPATFPLVFLYSVVSNALGPLPWQVTSPITALAFVTEVPLLFLLLYRLWRLRGFRDAGSVFVLCQAVAWFILIGYFNDNLGTATRLRVLGWHCLLVCHGYWTSRAAARAATPVAQKEA